MTLSNIDEQDAEKLCQIVTADFGLEFDEFEPVDEATFDEVMVVVKDRVPDLSDAFDKCFEEQDNGDRYCRATGKSEFIELLDREAEEN